jgi:hypothetical protein
MSRVAITSLVPVAVLLSACASTPRPEPRTDFTNPNSCAEIVAQHREDPSLRVDDPVRPQRMFIPPVSRVRTEIRIVALVDERGRVAKETVVVEGTDDKRTIRLIQQDFARSSFTPARVGACHVPSLFPYSLLPARRRSAAAL